MTEAVIDHLFQSNLQQNSLNIVKKTKASFAGCPISDRALFKHSSCILPISIMGRKEHESHRFQATMQLINTSFKSCVLLVVDSLYRHTLKIETPDADTETLSDMALKAGDDWLFRNKTAYSHLSIPSEIIRWDRYLNHPDFQNKLDIVLNLYNADQSYKEAFDANVEEYLLRYSNRKDTMLLNHKEAFSCCLSYLQEECAGMCLWIEGGFNFEVYPTGRNLSMSMTYEKLIRPQYPDLLRPVGIRFKK